MGKGKRTAQDRKALMAKREQRTLSYWVGRAKRTMEETTEARHVGVHGPDADHTPVPEYDYEALTREDLRKQAKILNIKGRGSMKKAELIQAIKEVSP